MKRILSIGILVLLLSFMMTVVSFGQVRKSKEIPKLVKKAPSDGLCGLTDEDRFGFTYATLDRYIREGICEDEQIKAKIDRMHRLNLHKLKTIPKFELK